MTQFVDARSLSALSSELNHDVCIIGAGAAGIVLAINLSAKGLRVLLLEAGGEVMDGPTQSLYTAEQHGIQYYDLTTCRLRFLGGTTNHWGGYCRENDPIDYRGRPELDIPSWPFDYDHIKPYVERAATLLGLTAVGFDPQWQASHVDRRDCLLDNSSNLLLTKVFQFTQKKRFRELFGPALRSDPRIDVINFANVTHLQLNAAGTHLDHLVAKTTNGKTFQCKARQFVLATHAIENSRLLLASNDVHKTGIGNRYEHVGRYFMEHPYVHSGLLMPSSAFPDFYNADVMGTLGINANLGLTKEAMVHHGILQYYCRFIPIYSTEETIDALRKLKSGFWQPADIEAIRALGTAISEVPDTLRYLGGKVIPAKVKPLGYQLDHRIEQAPRSASRVTLSSEGDMLGMRKAVLTWQLDDLDIKTFQIGQKIVVNELTRLGMGRFDAPDITRDIVERSVYGHYHHIGTTRMSKSPRDGVVDENGRVHEVRNLYVAGSSVFPTAGYSGPTMMIVALAMRLAEHLAVVGH